MLSKFARNIFLILCLGIYAGSVKAVPPNVFSTGDPILASEMNENFDDLDTRMTAIENSASNLDFSGYGTPFSADGAPKNVTVLRRDLGGGDTHYVVRSRYANSTEQVSIDGVLTVKPFIANYADVTTDSGGNITSIGNYIEALDDAVAYDVYNIEESTYDVNTLFKTVTADTETEYFVCGNTGNGSMQVCLGTRTVNLTGAFSIEYEWSRNHALGGPFTFNGMTFPDVRMESYTGTAVRFRIRAKDIGTIYDRTNAATGETSESTVIFYRANGITGGTLAGTPFDTGQPLDGLFF